MIRPQNERRSKGVPVVAEEWLPWSEEKIGTWSVTSKLEPQSFHLQLVGEKRWGLCDWSLLEAAVTTKCSL